jgi:two-component system, cell cycle response regulator DivK
MKGYILIVDDNHVDLKLQSELLQMAGFEISTAVDAESAQILLGARVPDLILMDISLPGMDGLTFTRIIKADSRLQRVPVVALTAAAMKGDDRLALEAGCAAYITKPIDTRRFPGQIGGVLNRAS